MSAPTRRHETHVADRFGAQAASYVASAVHAAGADLDRIAERIRTVRPARALDLGCGGGHVAFAMAPHAGTVTALDLSPDMLAAVAAEAGRRGLPNIATEAGSAAALPFPDAAFDAVATRFSAHHWRDVRAGLAEARRVAKPGAPALVADIVAPDDALLDTHLQAVELLRDPSHVRDYSVPEWLAMLAEAGFTVDRITQGRLRMDFATWIARMRTPEPLVTAIRALQATAPDEVAHHFGLAPDGSFWLDTVLIEAVAA
ncbi:methyltransferase domain-containing protein [Methylobacterium sp. WL30]|uniref:class I SAM-dependent methyltransferase n=2 Tax=Methylobacterium TaxID=407 RepID=UPI0011CC0DEB|nr:MULTISPECIES: class I SAM-dependent methyltransferase [unclassified Methylobacterium]TXN36472.1 methyltransferase domain-containing protein [Methylobacterium sp. WL93]TXN47977.1 methyltransferase domain-containing protein [Methylobacterium sp. WL119]TXN62414.1 methyltransferase domain-containing protein [Methylobacterium sp. WL30]